MVRTEPLCATATAGSAHKRRPELARSQQAVAVGGAPEEPPFDADEPFLGVAAGGSFIAAQRWSRAVGDGRSRQHLGADLCRCTRLRSSEASLRPEEAAESEFIADVAKRQPRLFAHWRWGLRPDGWTMGAR